MKCSDVIQKLEELSPMQFAQEWDNVGLLLGRKEKKAETILLALDATDEVVEAAVQCNADMLITHHPLIFKGMKRILGDDFIGRRVISLLQHDITYYAMHTNFDVMGMADAAADEIGLKDRKVLNITYEDEIAQEGCGRYGRLPGIMSLAECAEFIKQKFSADSIRVYGEAEAMLETAAIMPGSGEDMISDALKAKADVMITGDIKYHQAMDSLAKGMFIIDAGHYALEKIFVPYVKEYLQRELPQLAVKVGKENNPFWILK